MPAALRKSRRERYCEYGVISDDLTGTDLNFVFMIIPYFHIIASLREIICSHNWGLLCQHRFVFAWSRYERDPQKNGWAGEHSLYSTSTPLTGACGTGAGSAMVSN